MHNTQYTTYDNTAILPASVYKYATCNMLHDMLLWLRLRADSDSELKVQSSKIYSIQYTVYTQAVVVSKSTERKT